MEKKSGCGTLQCLIFDKIVLSSGGCDRGHAGGEENTLV